MSKENKYPFRFDSSACETCSGRCCTGESGYIWLEIEEIEAIASALNIKFAEMVQKYTRRIQGRFSLKEVARPEGDFACIFFRDGCQIYDLRPKQCRTYPFWPRFQRFPEEVRSECPGVSPTDDT